MTFDYGNNIRAQAQAAGVDERLRLPGLRAGLHPAAVREGKGPFRWVALSGDPADIRRTDEAVLELFPENEALRALDHAWRRSACRSRACRRASAGWATASGREPGCASTSSSRPGKCRRPS